MSKTFGYWVLLLTMASCGVATGGDAQEGLDEWQVSRDSASGAGLKAQPVLSPLSDEAKSVDSTQAASSNASGTLPASDIKRTISMNAAKVRYCYEAGLQANPRLEGRVTVGFTILADGQVGAAHVRAPDSTLNDAHVWGCIVGVVNAMRFPAPVGGSVDVTYPYVFTRE